MVGANPKFRTFDRAGRVTSVGRGAPVRRKPRIAPVFTLAPARRPVGAGPAVVRSRCNAARRRAPARLPPMRRPRAGDTFDDRFPKPQFKDRFPTASESLVQRQPSDAPARRTRAAEPAPYRVASLAPQVPYQRPAKEDQTTLVSLKSSAFPYFGNNPRTDAAVPERFQAANAAATAATAAGSSGRTRPSTTTAC